jgi:hypothetical protein
MTTTTAKTTSVAAPSMDLSPIDLDVMGAAARRA